MNRICPECEREILAELVELDGGNGVVDLAGDDPDLDDPETIREATVEATIRLSCSCSHYDVDVNATTTSLSAFLPDEWDYDDEGDA
jgi:hypothetical protein